jgi:hypothetical protein
LLGGSRRGVVLPGAGGRVESRCPFIYAVHGGYSVGNMGAIFWATARTAAEHELKH